MSAASWQEAYLQDAPLRILIVEDEPNDAELVVHALRRASLGFTSSRTDTEESFRRELHGGRPDVILSDFSMPRFSGLDALSVAQEICPDVPFIFVSGTIGEEKAINALKSGATDYILKHDLARLGPAVQRALAEAQIQRALRHSDLRFRLAASTGDVWDWDIATGSAEISPQWKLRLGYQDAEIQNTAHGWLELLEPGDRQRVLGAFAAHIRSKVPYDIEYRALGKDGSYRWSHAKGQAVWDDSGRATYMAGSVVDITERKIAELKVKRLNRIHAVLSSINSLIVRIQSRDELFHGACGIAVNAGAFRLAWIGLVDEATQRVKAVAWAGAGADYIGNIPLGLNPKETDQYGRVGECISEAATVIVQNIATEKRVALREEAAKNGFRSFALFPLSIDQKVIGVMALYASETEFFDGTEVRLLEDLARDIAFSLDHLEKSDRLNYLAYYDSLTGLANRGLLQDRLNQLIQNHSRSEEESEKIALIWLNIDRFKNINDTLGRHAGDALIKLVAHRLAQVLGSRDRLARMGADQFGVILTYRHAPSEVAHLVNEQIFPSMERAFLVEGKDLYLTSRAGIALFPDDGQDADMLFANAEAASRAAGVAKGRYQFYAASMNARVRSQLDIESRLHRALENNEFILHYQPKVSLSDGRLTGMEALIRWNDPEKGLVSPTVFIPVLEETGMIIDVGRWVMEQAIADHDEWHAMGLNPPRIAVNVSAVQMRHSKFQGLVEKALKGRRNTASFLDIEITESLFMEDIETNVQRLRALRDLGIRLAVDDFGTGYSSLSYLKRFPIDYLKIDQSFVRDVTSHPDAAAICGAIIDLAHNLKLKVIAEGVETQAQLSYLRRRHCDEMQGYYFSRPLPQEKIVDLLATGRGLDIPAHSTDGEKKILIVDDEAGMLASMERLLRHEGYAVLTAAGAREGFEMLAQHDIQVILSDQRMPEMSGTDFLARARDLYPDTVRIVLSGHTDLDAISDAIHRGSIYRFLAKPCDDDVLRDNIREAFRHHEAVCGKRQD